MKKTLTFLILLLLIINFPLFSQQFDVTGKVTDETNAGIPGVSIVIKGTTNGTITDINGDYKITVPDAKAILKFSSLGYQAKEIIVGTQKLINVNLEKEVSSLDEVVVVGYGTTRKIDLTGSVVSVKTKDIPIDATTSVDQMLQGRVAGLVLSSVSAQPGGRLNINIRGGTNPLYVIDGIPILTNPNPDNTDNNIKTADPGIILDKLGFSGGVDRDPLNGINPSDIESIDILKDASAAAIYGSAAANGVILITTKKGRPGKVNVEYRGSYTIQQPKEYFQLMDAQEFMKQHNRFQLDQAMLTTQSGPYGTGSVPPITPFFSESEIAAAGKGTDWLNLLMRNGNINEHNISLSGGSDYTNAYASFNYFGNDALLKNSTYQRYSGRVNLSQQIGQRIKTSANMTFSQTNANNAATGANQGGPEKYNMLQAAYVYSPTVTVFDSLGKYSKTFDPKITNPAAFLIINDLTRSNRFMVNPTVEVKILNDLKLNIVGGMDRTSNNRSFYLPKTVLNVQFPSGMAQLMTGRIDNYSSEAYLTYNRQFNNSNLTVVGGTGYYKTLYDGFSLQAVNFFTDAFEYYNVSVAADKTQGLMNSYRVEKTKISQFFRINYSLNDKYIFSFVGRNDGSSIFAENKKWGFFPGISAAWKINQEQFIRDLGIFSDLKLRAGFGTAGNEGYIGNNPWKLYGTGYPFLIGTTLYPGVALSQLANPNLTWETDAITNVGLDLGLLTNRITSTIDYFIKTKNNLIDYNLLPSDAPIGRVADNIGSQRSKGWEFSLRSNNLVGDFTWSTDLTLSTYSLNWLTRNPQVALAPWIKVNDPVLAIYGWKTDGIIKSTNDTTGYVTKMVNRPEFGNMKYVDINNDSVLDGEDVVLLADATPKWSFGFNNTFRYKGFDLSIYIYGQLGRKIPNGYRNFLNPTGLADKIYPSNTITDIKKVWSNDNPEGIYPGLSDNSNPYNGANPAVNPYPNNTIFNDFWLVNGSFARIKNITLGYTLPEILVSKLKIKSVRIYADIQNIFVITKYKGIDPEVSDVNPYPQALSTTFGLNLSF